MNHLPLFSDQYLFSLWEDEYKAYVESGDDAKLLSNLRNWAERKNTLTEAQLEGQFVTRFFSAIWDYWGTGEQNPQNGYCFSSQYGVIGAGQTACRRLLR